MNTQQDMKFVGKNSICSKDTLIKPNLSQQWATA